MFHDLVVYGVVIPALVIIGVIFIAGWNDD